MQDQAYFVAPPSGSGPGVLLLPTWWGLTTEIKHRADRLADAGFTVLAPDLALGESPADEEEAERLLGEADPNRLVSLVYTSSGLLEDKAQAGPIGAVGLGMGGSLALWISVRQPVPVAAAVSFYGSQAIEFKGSEASYQIHLADSDRFISPDDAAFMEATMGLEKLDVTLFTYPETNHGFADPESEAYDEAAADAAWDRTVAFLSTQLNDGELF